MKIGQGQELFLAGLLIALGAGIGCASLLTLPGSIILPLLLLALSLSIFGAWQGRQWTWMAVLAAFFCVGMLRFMAADYLSEQDISNFARETVKVEGILREEPRLTEDNQGQKKQRYLLDVTRVRIKGQDWQRASGGIYVYARHHEAPAVRIGDKVTAAGKVRSPHGYQNPGQLDTKLLLKSQRITASLSAGKQGIKVEPVETAAFARKLADVRSHYRERMQAVMPKEDAAAIFAMLFGGYDGVNEDLVQNFTLTGLIHLLSVSGSHISLLAAVMAGLGTLLRLPKAATAVLVVGLIVIYSLLAGAVPPVIRSAIMGGLAFVALALNRERDARRILLVTGLVMLVIWPLLLFHISFQLSFLATAGLLYLAPKWQSFLRERGVNSFVAAGLSITLAAQLATLPVLAWYFNQLSLSSLLANLVVVPLVELLIVLGLFAGALAFALPFAGSVVFACDSLLLGVVEELTAQIAALPASAIWIPSLHFSGGLLYYVLLGLFLLTAEQREKLWEGLKARRKVLGMGALVLFVFVISWQMASPKEMQVHFIDVGQGDAALLITPHGHAFMFDCGGTRDGAFDVGAKVDVPYLLHYGVLKLDGIFLTHAHEDHAAGCGSLMKKIPVTQVVTADEGISDYARSMRLGDNDPLLHKFHTARRGDALMVDGVRIEVLYAPSVSGGDNKTGNEASNVYRVSYGKASFLFTGDLTKEREAELLAAGINPQSTVLKAGHHGSDTSSSPEFLEAVRPKFGIFCAGTDNSFGHPKPEIVKRFRQLGIKTYRTDEDGAVVFYTDGERMRVETYN
ncbi:MAG: DNA internalization-related competence protein ComEC/Rec2 [Selenomonas ruminantium]|uniref:DNA internalization-related competence protein ComEC/Rec2 n=1 Tax=Selenomonas ruminantium TaxID=971 RepID=A0A927WH07_SELRU|nr:DNA internalization-related competence protein ComEC/Rec2 [Selenomonas ruminantium]MBE6084241.1 DNA internalization-related competence protein ComEC/Rec2 [Selenomonas ruminantium]